MLDALWTYVVLFLIPPPTPINKGNLSGTAQLVTCLAMCWTAGIFDAQFVPSEMKAYKTRFLILGLSQIFVVLIDDV